MNWQGHLKAGLAGLRLNLDQAFVAVDNNVIGGMQPEARSGARWFGGKKGVEDERLDVSGDARSVVTNVNDNVIVPGIRAQS